MMLSTAHTLTETVNQYGGRSVHSISWLLAKKKKLWSGDPCTPMATRCGTQTRAGSTAAWQPAYGIPYSEWNPCNNPSAAAAAT